MRPAKGEFGAFAAVASSEFTALSAAARIAGMTEAVTIEPPESGPGGKSVSPSATSILPMGSPSLSAATCARIV